jgi:hypothetical protein
VVVHEEMVRAFAMAKFPVQQQCAELTVSMQPGQQSRTGLGNNVMHGRDPCLKAVQAAKLYLVNLYTYPANQRVAHNITCLTLDLYPTPTS